MKIVKKSSYNLSFEIFVLIRTKTKTADWKHLHDFKSNI